MHSRTQISDSNISEAPKSNSLLGWLCTAKAIRTFALSSVSIVLVLFLLDRGFSMLTVGAIFTATVVEDAIVTTLVANLAARIGMRRTLIAFSLLMTFAGLVLAASHLLWVIALAAVFGVISPAGYEGGPFGAIEQTIISRSVHARKLAQSFSWYHLSGYTGAAIGALVVGIFVTFTKTQHFAFTYEAIFAGYSLVGLILVLIYQQILASHFKSSKTKNDEESIALLAKNGILNKIPANVWKLSLLQGLDSFGGGFVTQAMASYWFVARFHAGPEFMGPLCFWGNVIAAMSFVVAPMFVKRFGHLNTMVFTHLPCSLGLCLIPLMPSADLAGLVILIRCIFSSMDIPARQAFTMLLVADSERPVAVALIDSSRAIAQGIAPVICGSIMSNPITGLPFFLAGLCKSTYDVGLYFCFRSTPLKYADLLKSESVKPKGTVHAGQSRAKELVSSKIGK